MCVILAIQPKVTVPFDKLELACDINKHGYGLSYIANGAIHTEYSVKTPNDPTAVQKRLEALTKYPVYLHLRHATVGEVSIENAHPFVICTKKAHKVDLNLMHNGTLWEYSPAAQSQSKASDTSEFSRRFVTPLVETFKSHVGPKGLLGNDLFRYILAKEVGSQSVVVLYDGFGNEFIVNKNKGKQFEGWWASNEYSFTAWHSRATRSTTTSSSSTDYRSRNADLNRVFGGTGMPWWEEDDQEPVATTTAKPANVNFATDWEKELAEQDNLSEAGKLRLQYAAAGMRINNTKYQLGKSIMSDTSGMTMVDLKAIRKSFEEQTGIQDLRKLGNLTEEDLVQLNDTYPKVMAHLIIQLLAEVTALDHKNKSQASTILNLTADKQ